MIGIELTDNAEPFLVQARKEKLLILTAGSHVLRILPPLTVSDSEIEKAVNILSKVLGS